MKHAISMSYRLTQVSNSKSDHQTLSKSFTTIISLPQQAMYVSFADFPKLDKKLCY